MNTLTIPNATITITWDAPSGTPVDLPAPTVVEAEVVSEKTWKRWTDDDDMMMLTLTERGLTAAAIAAIMDRTEKSIQMRRYVLGVRATEMRPVAYSKASRLIAEALR